MLFGLLTLSGGLFAYANHRDEKQRCDDLIMSHMISDKKFYDKLTTEFGLTEKEIRDQYLMMDYRLDRLRKAGMI